MIFKVRNNDHARGKLEDKHVNSDLGFCSETGFCPASLVGNCVFGAFDGLCIGVLNAPSSSEYLLYRHVAKITSGDPRLPKTSRHHHPRHLRRPRRPRAFPPLPPPVSTDIRRLTFPNLDPVTGRRTTSFCNSFPEL
jgi:hypothetical protein